MSESNQITGRQIAAGRVLAGVGQDELANAAQVSIATLRRMEASQGKAAGLTNNVAAVRTALESAGVVFDLQAGRGPGVRLKTGSAPDHPKPNGPTMDVVERKDTAVEGHRSRKR